MGAGTGTLTFLFTDLEGSTRAWEAAPEEMARALAEHDVALRAVVERFSGQVVKSTGDGLLAAFPDAASAVRAAIEAQRFLRSDRGRGLRARMGLHTGTSVERDGDHFGPALNRAARIMAVAHADQVLASGACAALAGADLDADVHLVDLGEHQLKDLASPERIFQVTAADLPDEFPPVRSELATS
ncbi:MAG TPA: adenylate/guanylate cyclase domain-containing protein, partial [Acidimicrobiales bacterium]|nr:adenylate/guanylate cyclase domain-containing protein [Acidimicrobiales bacterium]